VHKLILPENFIFSSGHRFIQTKRYLVTKELNYLTIVTMLLLHDWRGAWERLKVTSLTVAVECGGAGADGENAVPDLGEGSDDDAVVVR